MNISRIVRNATIVVVSAALAIIAAAPAMAQVRVTQQTGFNARAWSTTPPDANGVRYVGGDFSSYRAWVTGGGVGVTAQGSVDTRFPNVSGRVNAVAPDGAGGFIIAGAFMAVNNQSRSGIARINSDGSLNASFAPTITGGWNNDTAYSIDVQGNTVFIGGTFTTVNGTARSNLAALNLSDGTLLDWNPGANSWVRSVKATADAVYVGGRFTTLNGQSRNLVGAVRIGARTGGVSGTCLDAFNATDCQTSFAPNLTGGYAVWDFEFDGATTYLAGDFTATSGATSISNLAAVDTTTGALDTGWNPQVNGRAYALDIANGLLYVGGRFTQAGGQARPLLAAFGTTGSRALSGTWAPTTKGSTVYNYDNHREMVNAVSALEVSGSTVYVSGGFFSLNGQARNRAGALDATTGATLSWDPHVCDWTSGAASHMWGLAVSGSTVYLGGDNPCAGGLKRYHVAAIGPDGILTAWAPPVDGPVQSMSSNGTTIYMVGRFGLVNDTARTFAAAVNTDGTLHSWAPVLSAGFCSGGEPHKVLYSPARVYIAGCFLTVNGDSRKALAATNPTSGATDSGFNADITNGAWNPSGRALALRGSRLYVGGNFTAVGGTSRPNVAAVDAASGAIDTGWDPGTITDTPNWGVTIRVLEVFGNRVFMGGSFFGVQGVSQKYVAALDADTGTIDANWAPPMVAGNNNESWVYAITSGAGKIFLGGHTGMSANNGVISRSGVIAVDETTGALSTFQSSGGEVRGLSGSDAAVFVSGSFTWSGNRQNTAAISTSGTLLTPWPMEPGQNHPLSVQISGTDPGRVLSNPGGIDCGGSCQYGFSSGATVTLQATDPANSDFGGWGGACAASGVTPTCTVSVTQARSVTASYVAPGMAPAPSPSPSPSPAPVVSPAPAPVGNPAGENALPSTGSGTTDASAGTSRAALSRLPMAWRVGSARVAPTANRTRLSVGERIQLSRNGRYTLIYVDSAGERVPLAKGTRIASRKLDKVFYAPVMNVNGPDSLKISAQLARPGSKAITLRVILRNPDGTLEGEDIPLR